MYKYYLSTSAFCQFPSFIQRPNNVIQASPKKDLYTMTKKFLLHKGKGKKVQSSTQKQECGCPYQKSFFRSQTQVFSFLPSQSLLTFHIQSNNYGN